MTIFVKGEDDFSYMVRKLIEKYKRWVLSINVEQTEYLIAGFVKRNPKTIKDIDSYKYLRVTVTRSGTSENEIKNHIIQEKKIN